jgi:hypothetical protein
MESKTANSQQEIRINPSRLKNEKFAKDTKFLCCICNCLLSVTGSKVCSNCGEQFCKECISFNCPDKGCDPSNHDGVVMKSVRNELEKLEVKCKFSGCFIYIPLKDLINHENVCSYKIQKCEYCSIFFDSHLLEEHKLNCTEKIVKCENCSFHAKFIEFTHDCRMSQRIDQLEKKLEKILEHIERCEVVDKKILVESKEVSHSVIQLIKDKNNNIKNDSKLNNQSRVSLAKVDSKDLRTFLDYVSAGLENEVEKMLVNNAGLALARGTVNDHSKRTFKDITGFQYAIWALDWHMWKVIIKFLSMEDALEQVKNFKDGSWIKEHGEYVDWSNLIEAHRLLKDNWENWEWKKINDH